MNREKAQELLNNLISEVKRRFRQEIEGEQDEVLDRVIRKHRATLARVSWKASQKWCQWDEDGPVLFPANTRLYYRKGKTEILVLEYPPQTRLLKFKGSLVSRPHSMAEIPPQEMEKTYNFSLALPYTVFIFKFSNGVFDRHNIKFAFCDRPLRKLKERPLRPYLSNIDTTLSVCLGSSFDDAQLVQGDLVQQANYVMGYFWQSVFRDEWATHYWDSKHNFEAKEDHRMSSLQNWQEASLNDPLFVIDDVAWYPHEEETFGDILVKMLYTDAVNVEFSEELYNEFVDEFLEDMKDSVGENVEAAEAKVSSSNFEEQIQELLTSLT